jgi:hypothetical protein
LEPIYVQVIVEVILQTVFELVLMTWMRLGEAFIYGKPSSPSSTAWRIVLRLILAAGAFWLAIACLGASLPMPPWLFIPWALTVPPLLVYEKTRGVAEIAYAAWASTALLAVVWFASLQ